MDSVIEQEVEITMPDGVADAVLYRAAGDRAPGVIHLPDAGGPRPAQAQMAQRLAASGFNVLLPNIFYRTSRAPLYDGPFDFSQEATRKRFAELSAPLTPDAMERDGSAYVDFLASRPEISDGPVGVVGYCFAGAFSLRVAAARPDRVGAAASFHGGGLYKEGPASPHLVLPRVKARLYFGHARDDRGMPAEAIANFERALRDWGGEYESETYDALHGWTVPDSGAWNVAEAERAFVKLRELFAKTLG